jgi:hypothetical protein
MDLGVHAFDEIQNVSDRKCCEGFCTSFLEWVLKVIKNLLSKTRDDAINGQYSVYSVGDHGNGEILTPSSENSANNESPPPSYDDAINGQYSVYSVGDHGNGEIENSANNESPPLLHRNGVSPIIFHTTTNAVITCFYN